MLAAHGYIDPVLPNHSDTAGMVFAALQLSSDPQTPEPGTGSGKEQQTDLRGRLDGSTILLVEDEALVAMDIELALGDAGAHVLGPAASLSRALEIARDSKRIDGAILDIDLGGEDALPLAELLTARSVPLLFHTGVGGREHMVARFPQAGIRRKPVAIDELLNDLAALMG